MTAKTYLTMTYYAVEYYVKNNIKLHNIAASFWYIKVIYLQWFVLFNKLILVSYFQNLLIFCFSVL